LRSIVALPLVLLGCSAPEPVVVEDAPRSADSYREEAVQGMHDALLADVEAMSTAALDLQRAAPTPADRGWDPVKDAAVILAMKAALTPARTAYEHVDGALAPLFPDLDASIDARYDDFMAQLGSQGGDADLFDGQGVTGMHAIERIVYADATPA